jgi:glycosyltransferase involved in cell wall biosynthesis
MLISVIIPIYNVSQYIERCLVSALNQTYAHIEYILIDDHSPDDSMEKAHAVIKLSNKEELVKIIVHDENKGLSAARNTGLKIAKGDYIYFLDSDDELVHDSIEKLVLIAKKYHPDFIISEFNLIGSCDRKKYPMIKLDGKDILYDGEISEELYRKKWNGMACNKLINKKIFLNNDCFFYEGILHEDILWSFLLANKSKTMGICKDVTYLYRIRPNSITQKMSEKNFSSLLFIMKKMVEYDSLYELHKYHHKLFDYFSNLRIYFLKNVVRFYKDKEKEAIKRMINEVNLIFCNKEYNKISNYSMSSFLKIIPYKLPFFLSILYVKLLCLRR